MKNWLSRKLFVAVGGVVVIVLVNVGLPEAIASSLVAQIVDVLTWYLIGQSAVDAVAASGIREVIAEKLFTSGR